MQVALDHIPAELRTALDYERRARGVIDAPTYAHIAEGAGAESTLRANRRAFGRSQLRQRALIDCTSGSTACAVLGRVHAHPILLAPVSYQRLVHDAGELATADGAAAVDATMVLSTLSSVAMEVVAKRARAGVWFQLYLQPAAEDSLRLVRRAEAAGFEALVVTVDAPVTTARGRSARLGFVLPANIAAVNLPPAADGTGSPMRLPAGASRVFQGAMAAAPTWASIRWLIASTRLPVLVKGVLDADDARIALDCGAAGVIVSNHGGRVLDGVPASLECLAEIRARVGSAPLLLLDGGIRRGSDVFKALALGANAVLIGRLQLYGLAVAGALGVAHLLRLLREELEVTMALTGCPTVASISPAALHSPGGAP